MQENRVALAVLTYSTLFASAAAFFPNLILSDTWKVAARSFWGGVIAAIFLLYLWWKGERPEGFTSWKFWLTAFLQFMTIVPFSYGLAASGAAATQLTFFAIFPPMLLVFTAFWRDPEKAKEPVSKLDYVKFVLIFATLVYLFSDGAARKSLSGILNVAISAVSCGCMCILQQKLNKLQMIAAIAIGLLPAGLLVVGSPVPAFTPSSVFLMIAMGAISQGVPAIMGAYVVKSTDNLGWMSVLMMIEPFLGVLFERWPGGVLQTQHQWNGVIAATVILVAFELASRRVQPKSF